MKEEQYINREVLLEKIKYQFDDRDKRKEYPTRYDWMLDELRIIKEELTSKDAIDKPYIPNARAEHCINEFEYYFNENQLEDSFYDIYETIEASDLLNGNLRRESSYCTYICKEEKEIILYMVNKLENKIKKEVQ